jgi:hypothetical protein
MFGVYVEVGCLTLRFAEIDVAFPLLPLPGIVAGALLPNHLVRLCVDAERAVVLGDEGLALVAPEE